jgi:predicted enzyme related to lactoylglutathione lyase
MWEPRRHIGAELVNAPGALAWNDLATPDPAAAKQFYSQLFGWTYEDFGLGNGYEVIKNGDRSNGGVRQMAPEESGHPPYWSTCFACESTDATLEKAVAAGANVLMPAVDMGDFGRVAALQDPQGAAFVVYSGDLDD